MCLIRILLKIDGNQGGGQARGRAEDLLILFLNKGSLSGVWSRGAAGPGICTTTATKSD